MKRMLIVEDQEVIQISLKSFFEDQFTITITDTCLTTRDVIRRESFDVILWDGNLSDGDTIGLIVEAKLLHQQAVMIAMSADEILQELQKRAGCSVFCEKCDVYDVVEKYFPI